MSTQPVTRLSYARAVQTWLGQASGNKQDLLDFKESLTRTLAEVDKEIAAASAEQPKQQGRIVPFNGGVKYI